MKSLPLAYAMKKKMKKEMASGYEPMPKEHEMENEPAEHEDMDMIARIMHKRKMMSEGGKVANDTPPIADSMEADYDDLALRDDLEQHDTGATSGDELGNEQKEHDEHDLIARIMASRRKKDHNPSPA